MSNDPSFVVKIQRPIMTNEPESLALIYNKDRSIRTFLPLDTVLTYFKGDELKVYCQAQWEADALSIHSRLADADFPSW